MDEPGAYYSGCGGSERERERERNEYHIYVESGSVEEPICGVAMEMWASQVTQWVKNLPANAGDTGDMGSIPGLGRFPGGGHGSPLQYFCRRIPWTEEPGRGSQSVRQDLARTHACSGDADMEKGEGGVNGESSMYTESHIRRHM